MCNVTGISVTSLSCQIVIVVEITIHPTFHFETRGRRQKNVGGSKCSDNDVMMTSQYPIGQIIGGSADPWTQDWISAKDISHFFPLLSLALEGDFSFAFTLGRRDFSSVSPLKRDQKNGCNLQLSHSQRSSQCDQNV